MKRSAHNLTRSALSRRKLHWITLKSSLSLKKIDLPLPITSARHMNNMSTISATFITAQSVKDMSSASDMSDKDMSWCLTIPRLFSGKTHGRSRWQLEQKSSTGGQLPFMNHHDPTRCQTVIKYWMSTIGCVSGRFVFALKSNWIFFFSFNASSHFDKPLKKVCHHVVHYQDPRHAVAFQASCSLLNNK